MEKAWRDRIDFSTGFSSQIEKDQLIVLQALAQNAAKPNCTFLEIGSWIGDSTIALGKVAKEAGGTLFCVDWWKGSEGTNLEYLAKEKDVFSLFWERVCNAGLENTVIPVRGDAKVSLSLFSKQSFDLVFVDGDHRYDHALHDIEKCKSLVKPNGVLCGHDCEGFVSDYDDSFLATGKNVDFHESVHCGVVLAVGENFSSYDIYYSIWCTQLSDGQWGKLKQPIDCLPYQRQTLPPPLKQFREGAAQRYGDAVYLIPNSLHGLDVRDEQTRSLSDVVRASSLAELEKACDSAGDDSLPFLVSPCFHGSNIVKYQSQFYVIPCDFGLLDLVVTDISEFLRKGEISLADSHDEAVEIAERCMKERIAEGRHAYPQLVDSDYGCFDLYFWAGSLYAFPSKDRERFFDLSVTEFEQQSTVLQAKCVLEARKEIESFSNAFCSAGLTRKRVPGATIHKCNAGTVAPLVSIILLDWECRELFFALDWLNRMDGARDRFEIIWVELYNRVVPEAMEKCDVVMTLDQKGTYHKHKAYNAGLLQARGKIVTVCDSDAVFQPNFIDSILDSFDMPGGLGDPTSKILMHHEYRSPEQYPKNLDNTTQLKDYPWIDLWPNVGACLSVSRLDAMRFGGFDEHKSYRGYMCGPYDLGWRMVNAGIPEVWFDENKSALWHFAHPDPMGTYMPFSFKLFREISYPHIDGHALTAVEAFSSGRTMPLKENREIWKTRMRSRQIGSEFEARYSDMTQGGGFSLLLKSGLYIKSFLETIGRELARPFLLWLRGMFPLGRVRRWLGKKYRSLSGS